MALIASMAHAFLILALFGLNLAAPIDPPFYLQCDPRWGNDQMGTPGDGERSTICGEGCAMTSLAMALASLGTRALDGGLITPKSLNQYLIRNKGYLCAGGDCNNLVLSAPDLLSSRVSFISEAPPPSFNQMAYDVVSRKKIYLSHVNNRSHFVLPWNAFPNQSFAVNNPMQNPAIYPYTGIADVISYTIRDLVPKSYPLWKQCDPRWGGERMINLTVCQVGCLMSSISMALAGHGIQIPINMSGKKAHLWSDPGTFNSWLKSNGGYEDGDDLDEAAVPAVAPGKVVWPKDGMHTRNDIPYIALIGMLTKRVLIANVMAGRHFVLVVGTSPDGDTLYVNDPGFSTTSYSYSKDVVGWRIFDMVDV